MPPQLARPPHPETEIAGAVLLVYVPLKLKPVISEGALAFEFRAILAFVIVTEPPALRVMPTVLGIVTCVDQVQVPEGTTTVSPDDAELIAVCTADDEHEAAVMVFALAVPQRTPE
jgi:hypothetical protein